MAKPPRKEDAAPTLAVVTGAVAAHQVAIKFILDKLGRVSPAERARLAISCHAAHDQLAHEAAEAPEDAAALSHCEEALAQLFGPTEKGPGRT